MPIIHPLVSDFFVHSRYLPDSLPSPLASPFSSGNFALRNPQITQRFLQPPWITRLKTIGCSDERFQPHIDSDSSTLLMRCDLLVRDFQHQANVPFLAHTLDDNVLDICAIRDVTVKNDFHFANILDVEPDLPIFHITQLAPIVVAILNTLEAVIAFKSWKAWCFACLHPAEERRKRLIQPAQHLLNAGCIEQAINVGVVITLIAKDLALICEIDPFARLFIHSNPLF